MPSSPDALLEPRTWEPAELTRPAVRPIGVPAPWSYEAAFVADAVPAAAPAPAPFEVSSSVGVPAAILAPARQAARAAGYAAGWSEGLAAARAAAAAEADAVRIRSEQAATDARTVVERAVAALTVATAGFAGRAAASLAEVEQLVLDAAYDIAEAVVGASLRHDPARGVHAVARALALVPDATGVTVALHPADHATVVASGALPDGVQVVPDASLAPGDALATSGATTVEACVAAGLARVREVLAR